MCLFFFAGASDPNRYLLYSQLPTRKKPEFRRHTIADSCPSLIETKEWPDSEGGLAVLLNPRKHWRRKTTDFSKSLQRPTWRRPQASTTLHSDNDEEMGTIKTRSKRRVLIFWAYLGKSSPMYTDYPFFLFQRCSSIGDASFRFNTITRPGPDLQANQFVRIRVLMVDPESPLFASRYECVST